MVSILWESPSTMETPHEVGLFLGSIPWLSWSQKKTQQIYKIFAKNQCSPVIGGFPIGRISQIMIPRAIFWVSETLTWSDRETNPTIPSGKPTKLWRITIFNSWLVVYLPLWKIWVRQLGWWNSQYMGKSVPNHQPAILVYQMVSIQRPSPSAPVRQPTCVPGTPPWRRAARWHRTRRQPVLSNPGRIGKR